MGEFIGNLIVVKVGRVDPDAHLGRVVRIFAAKVLNF